MRVKLQIMSEFQLSSASPVQLKIVPKSEKCKRSGTQSKTRYLEVGGSEAATKLQSRASWKEKLFFSSTLYMIIICRQHGVITASPYFHSFFFLVQFVQREFCSLCLMFYLFTFNFITYFLLLNWLYICLFIKKKAKG